MATRLALGLGIPTAVGAGIGAIIPPSGRTKKQKAENRKQNIAAGAILGAGTGLMIAPSLIHTPRHTLPHWAPATTTYRPVRRGGGASAYTPRPRGKASAGSTVGGSTFRWAWSPPTSARPTSGAPSWRQAAAAGPHKPPPSGSRGAPRPGGPTPPHGPAHRPASPPPSSYSGRSAAIKPPTESEVVQGIAKKLSVPGRPGSKAELNKIFRQKAETLHPDKGGSAEAMGELSRWHGYWKTKLSSYNPHFQSGFSEELSKIASL